ncbi:MAG TPA: protein kinase [Myxococcaceae bacterium]|nr:protein kinase [Myxococcaceae bacterium]
MAPGAPSFAPLAVGTVVAGRFTLHHPAGQGGMGVVYRAHDAVSGRTVALKLLHAHPSPEALSRFVREAEVLSGLHHPGIVAYVAHGAMRDGQPFLAMEWLEGENLAQRLVREPLPLGDTLRLLRRAAEVLAVAHERGIVHRDIKPSNLLLRGGRPEDVVLLDFGLARVAAASQAITRSTAVLGTLGYMAPEQASSQGDICACADLFSLGCVLYECLTRQPPFHASHPAAVLAKILYAEPAPLSPELPAALQPLLDSMLAKAPEQRLRDGAHLLRELARLSEQALEARGPGPAAHVHLPNAEQHLVSVLLATPLVPPVQALTSTLTAAGEDSERPLLESLRQWLQAHGARAAVLADGSLLATFVLERGTATDQAALAAQCALFTRERWPESFVVLTTGLTPRGRPLPTGEVVERAGEILRGLGGLPAATAAQVLLDEVTAGLLGARFQLDKVSSGLFQLRGELLSADESRPLLGRPTPCVGRLQELALLEMGFSTCAEDSTARALLVTAPAGTGKSRLRHEFLRRLERRAEPPRVLLGRGDPMHAGSAYGLLGQAVRRLCGVVDGEPLEVKREKLSLRASRHLPPAQARDTVEFLGELCGIAFPADGSALLRSAYEEPRLMSSQVTRAMVALLRAELSQGPVLLVLEDLHWSDTPTVRLVGEVLGELSDSPLMVLALARPEVKELFPELWERHLQRITLRGLSLKASALLVQEVVGAQLSPAVASRLAEQAAGNALLLEELIRGMVEGRGEETPGTVLAMLQSRVQRLEPGPRRVLLAGSIFGRSFWAGALEALLDEGVSPAELERCLRQLGEQELVEQQADSRFPEQAEYRFRHALVRDAAYSLVPEGLKPVGHRQAGAWLEAAGEQDPLVLAEHYQRGQEQEKAVLCFTRAGERLFERQDLPGAQRCVEAALSCGPTGAALTALRALEASIAFWLQDFARSYALGSAVWPELRPGSAAWERVVGGLILVGMQSGRYEEAGMMGALFVSTEPDADATPIYIRSACFLACMTSWCGMRQEASFVLERMSQVGSALTERDGVARGWLCCARGYFEHFLEPRPWHSRQWAEQGTLAVRELNLDRNLAATRTLLGLTLAALGEVPEAVAVMHQALEGARRSGQGYAITYSQMHLALVLVLSSEPAHHEEAHQLAARALETEQVNVLQRGLAHLALAKVAAARAQLPEAEAQARRACEVLNRFVPYQLIARATLCSVLLAAQRAAQARAEAEQGVQGLERIGGAGATTVGMWLALAEACFAQADVEPGEAALRQALRCVSLRAGDIPEPRARERFLSQVPENARAQQLALQRWGADWERQAQ